MMVGGGELCDSRWGEQETDLEKNFLSRECPGEKGELASWQEISKVFFFFFFFLLLEG